MEEDRARVRQQELPAHWQVGLDPGRTVISAIVEVTAYRSHAGHSHHRPQLPQLLFFNVSCMNFRCTTCHFSVCVHRMITTGALAFPSAQITVTFWCGLSTSGLLSWGVSPTRCRALTAVILLCAVSRLTQPTDCNFYPLTNLSHFSHPSLVT